MACETSKMRCHRIQPRPPAAPRCPSPAPPTSPALVWCNCRSGVQRRRSHQRPRLCCIALVTRHRRTGLIRPPSRAPAPGNAATARTARSEAASSMPLLWPRHSTHCTAERPLSAAPATSPCIMQQPVGNRLCLFCSVPFLVLRKYSTLGWYVHPHAAFLTSICCFSAKQLHRARHGYGRTRPRRKLLHD